MKPAFSVVAMACILAGPALAQPGPGAAPSASSVPALNSVAVPEGNGKPVLLDGLFAPGEWDDALRVPIHPRVELLLKISSGYLFLGLKFDDAAGIITDLWMTSDDRTVYQMHSSGQLGEGVLSLPVAEAMPGTVIGYTKDWDANEIKSDSKKKAEWQAAGRPPEGYRAVLFPSDGKEYQIALSKFAGRRLKMRFLAGHPKELIIYPGKTDLRSTENWLELDLPGNGTAAPGDARAGQQAGDQEKEMRAIEKSIRDCIGWAKAKDFKLLYGVIANDADFLEVHPDGNVVRGFEDFRKAEKFWGSPDFKAVRYDIRDLRIKLSRSGDVAWFYCLLDDINEWKGQPANWENTRWSGVLEKRDGRWVTVQQHFSFAAKS